MEKISEAAVTVDSVFKKTLSGNITNAIQLGKSIDTADPVTKLKGSTTKPLVILGYAYLKAKGLI